MLRADFWFYIAWFRVASCHHLPVIAIPAVFVCGKLLCISQQHTLWESQIKGSRGDRAVIRLHTGFPSSQQVHVPLLLLAEILLDNQPCEETESRWCTSKRSTVMQSNEVHSLKYNFLVLVFSFSVTWRFCSASVQRRIFYSLLFVHIVTLICYICSVWVATYQEFKLIDWLSPLFGFFCLFLYYI